MGTNEKLKLISAYVEKIIKPLMYILRRKMISAKQNIMIMPSLSSGDTSRRVATIHVFTFQNQLPEHQEMEMLQTRMGFKEKHKHHDICSCSAYFNTQLRSLKANADFVISLKCFFSQHTIKDKYSFG